MALLIKRAREQPALLGKHNSMVGIVAEPFSAASPPGLAVLLLNAGIVHRVGPNRMNVLLARDLAAAGIVSLRFDMSGLGDSQGRKDAMTPIQSAMADIGEALDWLEANEKIRNAILFGLCSGADHAILYASGDRRVIGMVLLDPSLPRTSKYFLCRTGGKISRFLRKPPARALSALGNFIVQNVFSNRDLHGEEDNSGEQELSDAEVHNLFVGPYTQCVAAGVQILAVLTGQEPGKYRDQLLDAFPSVEFGERLTLEYLPDTDHTFRREIDRAWLTANLIKWINEKGFAGAGSSR
jgi:Serine aminopeptidase, S33